MPISDGTVLIHDGRILAVGFSGNVKIPSKTQKLDVGGAVVTAGFWNSHVHLMSEPLLKADQRSGAELMEQLKQMLTRWGFTAVSVAPNSRCPFCGPYLTIVAQYVRQARVQS